MSSAGSIRGSGYFSLKINGEDPPNTYNLLRSATGVEGPHAPPTAVIEFNDSNGVLRDKMAIVDGTKISISIGTSESDCETHEFRVFSPRTTEVEGARIIRAVCVLDKPQYLYDVRSAFKRGSSLDAIKDLCGTAQIEVETDVKPNDSMTWLSIGRPPRVAVNDIVKRMWLGDGALPQAVLSSSGKLILRDVSEQLKGEPKRKMFYMYAPEDQGVLVSEFRTKSISGLLNTAHNYGSVSSHKLMDGSTETYDSVNMQADGEVNINSEVRSAIVKTNMAHDVRDPGTTGAGANVHKNWHKAQFNNSKVAASFTEMGRALVQGYVGLQMLDCVEVFASERNGDSIGINKKDSGKWIIFGRTWRFTGGRYSEAYLLLRNYTPVEGTTPLSSKSTGNNGKPPVQSLSNTVRPDQLNSKLKQGLGGMSAVDSLAVNHTFQLSSLTSKFATEGMQFKTPELVSKYGENADFLDSIMNEFSMASLLSGLCELLSPLEKLSLNLAFDLGPALLSMLAARLDDVFGLLGSFLSDINALFAAGEIPEEYLDKPQISTSCSGKSIDDLLESVNDKFPSKCLDALSLGRLSGPSISLAQLAARLEDQIRDLLCSWGDGTVDGSATVKDAKSEVGSLSDYTYS